MKVFIEKDGILEKERLPNQPIFYYVCIESSDEFYGHTLVGLKYQNNTETDLFTMKLIEEKLKQHYASVKIDKYNNFYLRFTLEDKADAAFLELQFDHTTEAVKRIEIEI